MTMRSGWIRVRPVIAAVVGLLVTTSAAWAQESARPADSGRVVIERVVAAVNDAVILQSELDTRMVPLLAGLQSIEDAQERLRRQQNLTTQMLDELIAEELIIQAGKEANLRVEAKEIAAAIDEIKQQNSLDDAGLRAALAQQGYTVETYKSDVRRQILRMRAVNMLVRPRVTITDEDVRARYDAMSRRSAAVSKVHLQHILLTLPENPSAEQVAAVKARATEIMEKVDAGASFEDMAKQYSEDVATRDSGGDLGWIERGSIATEWEVIVFAMDKGEVRGPISGPRGLHVFYVEDLAKTDIKPFDELREQLRSELYRTEMDKQTDLWIEDLRKKAYIDRKL